MIDFRSQRVIAISLIWEMYVEFGIRECGLDILKRSPTSMNCQDMHKHIEEERERGKGRGAYMYS